MKFGVSEKIMRPYVMFLNIFSEIAHKQIFALVSRGARCTTKLALVDMLPAAQRLHTGFTAVRRPGVEAALLGCPKNRNFFCIKLFFCPIVL